MTQTVRHCDIMTLAGTRPEVIKLSEFVNHLHDYEHMYVYTGQHYSTEMRDIFFDDLDSVPEIDLKCSTSDVATMTLLIADLLRETKPSVLVVYGDTNSTLAGALAAKETKTTLVHIEAGLRSFDMRMAEERNRIKIDSISDYLLCPTSLSKEFLSLEGITNNVSVTGNLIVDVCRKFSNLTGSDILNDLPKGYLLLTLHRAENVDDIATLKILSNKLSEISQYKIIFPIHPRTRKNLRANKIDLPSNVTTIDPVGYLDFLALLKGCRLVLTDSGGVQEEAVILGKPCVTLRHTTERWETILMGANRLCPLFLDVNLEEVIEQMLEKRISGHPYGESVTARNVDKVKEIMLNGKS